MTAPTDRTETILDIIDAGLAPADAALAWVHDPDSEAAQEAGLEAWTIDGERTATWCANKLRRAELLVTEAEATAAALRALADEHVEQAKARTDHDVRYFTGKLRQYHEEMIAGTRKHTTTLPGAKLADRAGGVTTEVTDEAALLDWCEEHLTEAVEYVDPKVSKAKLKKATDGKVDDGPGTYPAVSGDGEIVPGVQYVHGERSFGVELTDLALTDDEPA